MTPKQVLLKALNGEATRQELIDAFGIINKDGKYVLKRKEVAKKEFTPPSLEEVVSFFIAKGYSKEGAKKAYDYYTIGEWKDTNGKVVKNWKQKMFANWFKDEYKIKPTHTMYKPLNI